MRQESKNGHKSETHLSTLTCLERSRRSLLSVRGVDDDEFGRDLSELGTVPDLTHEVFARGTRWPADEHESRLLRGAHFSHAALERPPFYFTRCEPIRTFVFRGDRYREEETDYEREQSDAHADDGDPENAPLR